MPKKMKFFTGVAITALSISGWTADAAAMSVSSAEYGRTHDGIVVHQFTLSNDHGMTVKVLDYAGTITQVSLPDKDGVTRNVVMTLPDIQAYEARPNFSSIVGRFANRIGGGGFTLAGKFYKLDADANGITSHGGPKGFSKKMWQAASFSGMQRCGVRMSYASPDGEGGFPGAVMTTVTFTLDNRNQLTIQYEATTSKTTVVNFTHHMFFNLDSEGSIADEIIRINASHYLPVRDSMVVTGSIDSVAGTPFDLRKPVLIAAGLKSAHSQIATAHGYDHNFVLDKPVQNAMSFAAELQSLQSGIVMTVSTTEPGIQFYTGNAFNGKLVDMAGHPILKNGALALETQHFPDSPNHDNFPSTVLKAGEVFKSATVYRFHLRKPVHQ